MSITWSNALKDMPEIQQYINSRTFGACTLIQWRSQGTFTGGALEIFGSNSTII